MYKFVRSVCSMFMNIVFMPRIEGVENLDLIEGGYLICPNHRSNWDALFAAIPQKKQLKFIAKDSLFRFPPLGWFFKKMGAYPIRRGHADIGAVKAAMTILKEGFPLMMFPQGKRYKTIEVSQGKSGAAMLAVKMKVPVLPMGISGKFIPFSRPVIRIGKPIYFDEYYGKRATSEELGELTDKIMTEIIALVD
ncbi:MAG: lysophospholipid acyltransferase family protein [Eubacteriales bacterium]|nr:lysophospholipid acyltransferase family protein [Eubacteriales bacterium]